MGRLSVFCKEYGVKVGDLQRVMGFGSRNGLYGAYKRNPEMIRYILIGMKRQALVDDAVRSVGRMLEMD